MTNRFGLHDRAAVFFLDKCVFARFPETIGDHVHRLFKIEALPFERVRSAILHLHLTSRMSNKFETVGALRTKMTTRDRRLRIALNTDQLATLMKCKLSASDTAIRTDGTRDFGTVELWPKTARFDTHRFGTSAVCTCPDLLQQRPIREQVFQHSDLGSFINFNENSAKQRQVAIVEECSSSNSTGSAQLAICYSERSCSRAERIGSSQKIASRQSCRPPAQAEPS